MSVLNGPNEGDWSVFAERMMGQRDAAREELARLRDRLKAAERLIAALENVRKLVLTTPLAREYDAARAAWEATR